MVVDESFTIEVLQHLVRIESINPSLCASGGGESGIALYTAEAMRALDLSVECHEPKPGRVSVVGRRRGGGDGRALMLNAHYDTVAVDGMADPFGGTLIDGRCYGRGAYDMKGSLAACLGAVKALRDSHAALRGDVLVAAVADEEHASIGTADLIGRYQLDGAIVTEPSNLDICLAHKGFVWLTVTVQGRPAHGSQFAQGIDANVRAGSFLARLGRYATELTARTPHPLVGPPSVHAPLMAGGTGMSTYADSATVKIERRTVPGETTSQVVSEIQALLDAERAHDATFNATLVVDLVREPFEVDRERPIVRALASARQRVLTTPIRYVGENPWMDSALLAAAGIETVVIGPHGAGAHALEEWVDVQSVIQLAQILAETATIYCA